MSLPLSSLWKQHQPASRPLSCYDTSKSGFRHIEGRIIRSPKSNIRHCPIRAGDHLDLSAVRIKHHDSPSQDSAHQHIAFLIQTKAVRIVALGQGAERSSFPQFARRVDGKGAERGGKGLGYQQSLAVRGKPDAV